MLPEDTEPSQLPPASALSSSELEAAEAHAFSLVRVEFKGNRRQYFSNPMEFPLNIGDYAVVRVEKGEDLGRVVLLRDRLPEGVSMPQYEVLRRATARDLLTLQDFRSREIAARQVFKEKVIKNNLEMKLVDVEYQFDGRKLTFFFTADGRVDFRQLVKDLAAAFRTRIELRQIGVRDEVRRFSGAGLCGQLLCCASFMSTFCPITTQMAKDQNLPLNPAKISGCCGRLKCCLRFEICAYREALKTLPRWDVRLETKKGPAVVEKLDIFNMAITLHYESGEVERLDVQRYLEILAPGFKPPLMTEEAGEEEETLSDFIDDTDNGECDECSEGNFE